MPKTNILEQKHTLLNVCTLASGAIIYIDGHQYSHWCCFCRIRRCCQQHVTNNQRSWYIKPSCVSFEFYKGKTKLFCLHFLLFLDNEMTLAVKSVPETQFSRNFTDITPGGLNGCIIIQLRHNVCKMWTGNCQYWNSECHIVVILSLV